MFLCPLLRTFPHLMGAISDRAGCGSGRLPTKWVDRPQRRLGWNKMNKTIKTILIVLALFVPAACNPFPAEQVMETDLTATWQEQNTLTPTPKRTSTIQKPTASVVDSTSLGPTRGKPANQKPLCRTPRLSCTSAPSTPTPFRFPTPYPRVSDAETKKMVAELLKTNAGCLFPCWWGITPGETTWPEAYQFLAPFVNISAHPEQADYSGRNPSPENIQYGISYPFDTPRGTGGFAIYVINNRIDLIFAGVNATKWTSSLSQILHTYGAPTQIYVQTLQGFPGPTIPLTLVLYYQEKNFLVRYEIESQGTEDAVIACPGDVSPQIHLWAEGKEISFQTIEEWTIGGDTLIHLKPLEEVTDFTVQSFTETFSSRSAPGACITTKKEHW